MDNADAIVIFERKHCADDPDLVTCEGYFKDFLYRVEVVFIDKTNPNDTVFKCRLPAYSGLPLATNYSISSDNFTRMVMLFRLTALQSVSTKSAKNIVSTSISGVNLNTIYDEVPMNGLNIKSLEILYYTQESKESDVQITMDFAANIGKVKKVR